MNHLLIFFPNVARADRDFEIRFDDDYEHWVFLSENTCYIDNDFPLILGIEEDDDVVVYDRYDNYDGAVPQIVNILKVCGILPCEFREILV